jgi:hypothetical protein
LLYLAAHGQAAARSRRCTRIDSGIAMKELEACISKLEAPFMPTGPVLICADTASMPEQKQLIEQVKAAGQTVWLVSSLDEAL